MGENCPSFTICLDYVGNGIYVDDGFDGIHQIFGEVVLARQEGDGYYWATSFPSYALKKRSLPLSSKLDPTFRPIIEAWRKRSTAK